MIYAKKPGDGSAREQAASCQRVMGGLANICKEYATKRYRSNVMNWGMVPFQMEADAQFEVGDYIFVPNIRKALDGDMKDIKAYVISDNIKELDLYIADMTHDEKEIVKAGCLINYNRNRKENKQIKSYYIMEYCEFGNTPFILSQNIKLIYNSLINDNILLSYDKK